VRTRSRDYTAAVRTIRELDAAETGAAYSAMLELRPHLGDRRAFVELVNTVQRPEGYRIIAAFHEAAAEAAAVAGFRIVHTLAWGRALYCDDLSTRHTHRRQGHAGALLDWLLQEAQRSGCDALHLDSGVQEERAHAHRLYFNKGMRISSHHFQRSLR
jgi:GNAT superfamily N-acetyltransferase